MNYNSLGVKKYTVKFSIACLISVFCFVISIVYAIDVKDLLWVYENGKVMSEPVSYLDTLANPQNTFRPSVDVMVSGVLRLVVMLIAAFVFVVYIIDRKSTVSKSNTLAVLLIVANAGTMLTASSNMITLGFYISIIANVIFITLSIFIIINNYSKKWLIGIKVILGIAALVTVLSLLLCDTRFRIIEPICSLVISLGCHYVTSEESVFGRDKS